MEIVIVLFFYIAVIIFDFHSIVKKKMRKEVWIYSVTLVVTFTVLILFFIGIKVPGPTAPIKMLVESLLNV